jgi:tripartite-type tricarboxylate transporter receptor subunit TctC
MHRFSTWLGAAGLLLASGWAVAAPYPQQTVKLVVGFAAGGPSDLVARAFAEQAAKNLGQPMIVDNKPGANAVIATEAVAASKPDGHTLLAAATNHTMIPALYSGRIKFDADQSFAPVCTLASSATVLVVGPSVKARTPADLLGLLRASPGKFTYASPGQGSSPHLATEAFSRLTGVTLVHVPYKGAAPAVVDLLGGQVDLMLATLGLVLPSKTPTELATRLNQALNTVLNKPTVQEQFARLGADVRPGSPEAYARFIRSEIARTAKIVRDAHITLN